MNATPTNLNPGNAIQAQPQAGKQADAGASDTPFSQVLSGEIVRQGGEARKDADARDNADTAGSEAAQLLIPGAALTNEAVANLMLLASGEIAQQAADTPDTPDTAGTAEAAEAPAVATTTPPEIMLALGIPIELTKPAPVASPRTAADSAEPADALAAVVDARGSRPGVAPQNGQPEAAAVDASKTRTGVASPAAAQADVAAAPEAAAPSGAAAAAAFSEKLAAARQADPAMAGERVAELMSHPGMRAAVHAAAAEAVPASADPASNRLAPAVGTPAWGQALGDKLVWMAGGTQQTASLTLNPPNLGPLQVVLEVKNDQATASFYAVQPEVRQALESALPRLREMMTDAGIQLGQATVSADTPRQNDTSDRQAQRIAPEFADAAPADPAAQSGIPVSVMRSGRGLVDTFA